jgi:RNA polymerase sigma factor (sigma-70 family)
MSHEELAAKLEEKRPEMIRIISARLRYHGLEMDAEDVVQDSVLNLLEYETPIRPEDVAGLFYAVCARLAYNRIGKYKVHDKLDDEYQRVYQHDSQAQMRQRERLKTDVDLALAKLPTDRMRAVVRLVLMEGHYWAQAAKELKCSKRDIQLALDTAVPILQLELTRYDHRKRHVSASQDPYKKEQRETPDSTALQAVMEGDGASETSPVSLSITSLVAA